MEEIFKSIAGSVALTIEGAATLIIGYGAAEALYGAFFSTIRGDSIRSQRKQIWMRFGVWLLLGLEFELAADIIRTASSPTWSDIGQLGAIGFIRTFLNYFLERDLEQYEEKPRREGFSEKSRPGARAA